MPLQLSTQLPSPDEPLRVACITWNMANNKPTEADIAAILQAFPENTVVDAIVVAGQEETWFKNDALATQLASKFANNTAMTRAAYNTITAGSLGQVSQTILSKHKITAEHTEVHDKKNNNKGGIVSEVTIGGRPLTTMSVHLESKGKANRVQEATDLMAVVDKKVETYDALQKIACTFVLLIGDLNERDSFINGKAVDVRNDPSQRLRYLDLLGLTEAGKRDDISVVTYVDKEVFAPSPSTIKPAAAPADLLAQKRFTPSSQTPFESPREQQSLPNDSITSAPSTRSLAKNVMPYAASAPELSTLTTPAQLSDKKRVNETRGGKLDRCCYRGPIREQVETIVELPSDTKGKTTSDHKPVIAVFNCHNINQEESFEYTKTFVMREIFLLTKYNLKPEQNTMINNLMIPIKTVDIENKEKLIDIHNACLELRTTLLLEGEKSKMEKLDKPSTPSETPKSPSLVTSFSTSFFGPPKEIKSPEEKVDEAFQKFESTMKTTFPPPSLNSSTTPQ